MTRRTAWVTGGSSGVGAATVVELARRGFDVVLTVSKSLPSAEWVALRARSLGARAVAEVADVRDDAACRRVAARIAEEFGSLDLLVNNAGTTRFVDHADLDGLSEEDFADIFSVNLQGPFRCVRAARRSLEEARGQVLNVTSIAAHTASGSSLAYAASKAALECMTRSLARALAPRVRVNAVAPGFIAGPWLERGLGADYEAVKERTARATPLGRVCEPEDVARTIALLADAPPMITGQTLVVDGGASLGPVAWSAQEPGAR